MMVVTDELVTQGQSAAPEKPSESTTPKMLIAGGLSLISALD